MTLGTLSDRVMLRCASVNAINTWCVTIPSSGGIGLQSGLWSDGRRRENRHLNQFIRGGIAFATPPGTPLARKPRKASTSCCRKVNRKSGVMGNCASQIMPTAPACLRRSVMLNCAPVFLPVVHARGPTHVYFPDAFLTQMREAMPSTLSLMIFLPPVSARCAAAFALIPENLCC